MDLSIVLKGAKIIDVGSGKLLTTRDISIREGTITETKENIDVSDASIVELDCRGKFVIPGLFDCHTHLSALTKQPPEVQKEIYDECMLGESFREGELERLVLSDFLRRGITQIRDLGGPANTLKEFKAEVSKNVSAGPDIFFAGPMLEMPPLTGQQMNERWPGWTVAVDSPRKAENIVTSLRADGVSHIKVFGRFERKLLESLISCAGRSGLPVTCDPGPTFFHAISVTVGIESGISCFEHAKSVWYSVLNDNLKKQHDSLLAKSPEEKNAFVQKMLKAGAESISMPKLRALAETMVDRNIILCPTLHIFKFYSEKPEVFNDKEPEKFAAIFAQLFEVGCTIVKELAKHSVKLLVGQDSYIPRFTHNEMILLRDNGVTTIEIIRGATCYPAEWLGVNDKYGSVEVGKKANLVILEKNPIKEIRNIQSVHAVLRDGEIVAGIL